METKKYLKNRIKETTTEWVKGLECYPSRQGEYYRRLEELNSLDHVFDKINLTHIQLEFIRQYLSLISKTAYSSGIELGKNMQRRNINNDHASTGYTSIQLVRKIG
jgi:hypothetical protein